VPVSPGEKTIEAGLVSFAQAQDLRNLYIVRSELPVLTKETEFVVLTLFRCGPVFMPLFVMSLIDGMAATGNENT
jgi:hypothetical protein